MSQTLGKRRVERALALAAAGFLMLALLPAAVLADDNNVELFAGGQLDFANYVFIGATVSLPRPPNNNGTNNGFAIRGSLATGGYDYISGDLGTVKGNFGGGELDGVYQIERKNLFADFSLGVNDTYTNLVPNDPTNKLSGNQVELRLGTDGSSLSGPYRLDWYGYYGPKLEDYAAFIGGTHSLSPSWRLGLEGYSEGNPSYSLYQVGPYAGFAFDKTSEIDFSVGEAWQSGFSPRIYTRAIYLRRI
ncbi:MAG: cellulose biosynthesis protein BcsS [Candidatus Cybelea sp.]